MPADLLLGIDCSTTAAKAIAWNAAGAPVAEARAALATLAPRPGWAEQRAEEWWDATAATAREVAAAVGPDRIAAVAVTHQRETFVPVDAAGRPLRNAILWLDERSRPELAELDRRFGHDALHRLTGRPPSISQSLPKLLWLVEQEPAVAAGAAKVVDVGAFLLQRLTGEWATSLASADPLGLIDLARGEWAEAIIDGIGLRPDQFCPLLPPGTAVGPLTADAAAATGLRPDTPVVATGGDGQVACLGAGVTGPGRAYANLGTAVVGGTLVDRPLTDLAYRTCCGAIPGTFLLETALRSGTATLSWFIDHWADPRLGPEPFDAYETEARTLPPGAGGLLLVPYWSGVMNPYWDEHATGVVVGWTTAHRRHHLYRAILEGIAFEHRLAVDGLVASTSAPVAEHVLLGGGSRSPLWCQILADVLATPVSRARSADATNLGAAALAAAALGWQPTIAAAVAAMAGTTETFQPRPSASDAYDRLYRQVYLPLFPALRPSLDRLAELTAAPAAGAG